MLRKIGQRVAGSQDRPEIIDNKEESKQPEEKQPDEQKEQKPEGADPADDEEK